MNIRILPGDLLWTRSDGLVGTLIRFGETKRYHGWRTAFRRVLQPTADPNDLAFGNHIAVYVGDGWLIEALGKGLTLTRIDHYHPDQYRILRLADIASDVTPTQRVAAVRFAQFELARHDRYSWLGIASIVLQLLTPTKLDVSMDGAMICSAFGARCLEHAGVDLRTASPYTTMPSDLAVMALQSLRTPERKAAQ